MKEILTFKSHSGAQSTIFFFFLSHGNVVCLLLTLWFAPILKQAKTRMFSGLRLPKLPGAWTNHSGSCQT